MVETLDCRPMTAASSRQLHIMDVDGRIAAHTGRDCVDWCGHHPGRRLFVAGNMLAGAAVLDDTAQGLCGQCRACPFAQRLIAAMKAGEAAGGDKRGKQSAALLIHGEEEWSDLDLRVDDHADPLAELERLEGSAASAGCISAIHADARESRRDHRPRDHRRRHRQRMRDQRARHDRERR